MDRTTTIAGAAVILGMALIGFGVWRTAPPTALTDITLPDTWSDRTLERDGMSVALDVKPLARDGVLREAGIADVQFPVMDKASGQPLSGVAPGVRAIPGDTH
ncbi:SURF1-like protein [Pseudomonas sp. IT-196MI5]|uniref:hypothetical protein n=1 Tax=unclassified Pseudomonas TaxID=196821 RepID=UPI0039E0E5B0